MPRRRKVARVPGVIAGPRLAHEAARGAAEFEALRAARRNEWWRAGGPVEVRCRQSKSVWHLDVDGSWSAIDHGEAA